MKLKYIIPIFALTLVFFSCKKDDDNNAASNFDAAAQSLIDDATLIEYLQSHYYIPANADEAFGNIDTIMNGEASLYDELNDKLKIQDITDNGIDYKLYYFVENEGLNNRPEKTDSVLVNYRGFLLDSTKFDERLSYTWLPLTNVIRGWSHGFVNFKDGTNISAGMPNEPIDFVDTGNGILFIPSGLAYANLGNIGVVSIPPNTPLVFHVRLGLVERADHDNDLVLSSVEDIDGDGNANNDDTDGDRAPNYLDLDDDGDGVATRDELGFNKYIIDIGESDPIFASNEREIGRVEDADVGTITISTVLILDSNGDGLDDYLDPNTK